MGQRSPLPKRTVPPRMPNHLDEAARREWRRLVRILTRRGVLTEADGIALAIVCQECSRLAKALAQLSESGIILQTPSGDLQPNPLLGVVKQQVGSLRKHLREFGLRSASRPRLTPREQQTATACGNTARTLGILSVVQYAGRGDSTLGEGAVRTSGSNNSRTREIVLGGLARSAERTSSK